MNTSRTTASPTGHRAPPVLVRWPAEADRRAEAAAEGRPCLLVVADGDPLPSVGAGEDWIRISADERDVASRLVDLARLGRQAPTGAGRVVVVPEPAGSGAASLLRCLAADPGRVVARDRLLTAAGPEEADLASSVAELRAHLQQLGWALLLAGDGLVLGPPVAGRP